MGSVYAFRSNRSIKNVNPQELGEELERILAARGSLTPEIYVEEAASASSPLHDTLPWDDAGAAHQHRLAEARRLITSIRVINTPVRTVAPAYVSVRTPTLGRSYVPTIEALSDEQMRARVLAEIEQFVETMQRKYSHFQEVADLLAGLKKAVA